MRFAKWVIGVGILVGALVAVVFLADLGGGASAQADNNGTPQASRAQNLAAPGTLEALLAQKTGLSNDTINKMEIAALAVLGDKGSKFGFTPAQVANVSPATASPIINGVFDGAAKAAGVSPSDLFTAITSGQSLAQVAAAHGIDPASLKANLSTLISGQLAGAQSAGVLTPAQVGILNALITSNLDKVINATHKAESATP